MWLAAAKSTNNVIKRSYESSAFVSRKSTAMAFVRSTLFNKVNSFIVEANRFCISTGKFHLKNSAPGIHCNNNNNNYSANRISRSFQNILFLKHSIFTKFLIFLFVSHVAPSSIFFFFWSNVVFYEELKILN